jgi:hypothetical protein
MKSIRDFIDITESEAEVSEVVLSEAQQGKEVSPTKTDLPSLLTLQRKSIRRLPNGEKVALYYANKINKYVTIPYSDVHTEEYEKGSNLECLQDIVESNKSNAIIFEDGKTMMVNTSTAKKVLKLHESLDTTNRIKIHRMLDESKEQFKKVVGFAFTHIK